MTTTTITYVHLKDGSLLSEGVFAEGATGQLTVVNFLERCAEYGWYLTPHDREDLASYGAGDTNPDLVARMTQETCDAHQFMSWLLDGKATVHYGDNAVTITANKED